MRTWMQWMWLMVAGALISCGDDKEEGCEEGVFQCDGDVLQVCLDGGFEDEEDCAESGMMCHDMQAICFKTY